MTNIIYNFSNFIHNSNPQPVQLITLNGQLDDSNIENFANEVYTLINNTPTNTDFIIDFQNLSYMNSKSIGHLSDWGSKIKEKNGKIIITKPQSNIKDILNIVGLDKIIPLTQTLEEAKSLL